MDLESKNNGTDNDFGFPFVEVKPLKSKFKNPSEKKEGPVVTLITDQPETMDFGNAEKSIERPYSTIERKKKNQSPMLISLVFLIIIIMAAMAYFFYAQPEEETILEALNPATEITAEPEAPTQEENIGKDDAIAAENDLNATGSTRTNDQVPDSSQLGEVQFIKERGERPLFYIIAGSLPNERLANDEAQLYLEKGTDVWLILPQANTRNYRLSVGRYESLQSATEALEPARAEYGESLWILKF